MKGAVMVLATLLALGPLSEALAASDLAIKLALEQGRKLASSGELKQALSCFQRALDLATAKHPDSLDQAEALNELGECYREMGESEKAIPLLKKAIDIADKADTEKETLVAALANLALLYSDAGQSQEAFKCYMRCLPEVNKMPHPDMGTRAKIENNIGLLIARSNGHEKAIKMYELALFHAGDDDSLAPLRVSCLGNIAMSYKALNELGKAEQFASQAVKEARQSLGPEDSDYGFVLAQKGMILSDEHKYNEAKAALSEAIAILEKLLGSEHPQLANIKSAYAECLSASK